MGFVFILFFYFFLLGRLYNVYFCTTLVGNVHSWSIGHEFSSVTCGLSLTVVVLYHRVLCLLGSCFFNVLPSQSELTKQDASKNGN